jgi:protein gp37
VGKTSIEWTRGDDGSAGASCNPIVGCTECSPGCANCYAARLAATRLKNTYQYKGLTQRIGFCAEHNLPLEDGRCPTCRDGNGESFVLDMQSIVLSRDSRWTGEVRFLPERLNEPRHWKKPRRIFVCDMGDLFHEKVHDEWIDQVFAMMVDCPQHTFQILTKRAERMRDYLRKVSVDQILQHVRGLGTLAWPLPNVWCGVSVENQHFADERIPLLLETPAVVRWISAEPLLGPVDLGDRRIPNGLLASYLCGGRGLNWVVCGGESGPNARAMHPDWARSLRDQCQAAGVPFFLKQWGEWAGGNSFVGPVRETRELHGTRLDEPYTTVFRVGKKKAGRRLDGREWSEFPK